MLMLLAMQAAAPLVAGDWLVACDDRQRCTALSQVPPGGDPGGYPLAVLRRDGGVDAIDLPIPASVAPRTRLALTIDGHVVAQLVAPGGGAGLSLPLTGRLAAAVRRGRVLTLVAADGPTRARLSLTGLTAALATMQRAQRQPATPAQTIVVPAADPRAPRTLSRKPLQKLVGKPPKGCNPPSARAYRLDATHSLLEVTAPCAQVAAPYVLPDKGDAQPAGFDPPASASGAWDPAQRRYKVLLPAASPRDCGTRRAYAWDGARFRLAEERLIAECRRATYEVVTYRADIR